MEREGGKEGERAGRGQWRKGRDGKRVPVCRSSPVGDLALNGKGREENKKSSVHMTKNKAGKEERRE
jgi:hypothetical protein